MLKVDLSRLISHPGLITIIIKHGPYPASLEKFNLVSTNGIACGENGKTKHYVHFSLYPHQRLTHEGISEVSQSNLDGIDNSKKDTPKHGQKYLHVAPGDEY